MLNKVHKMVLKAFLEARIPDVLRCSENFNDFISLDSYIGGYCQALISSRKGIIDINGMLITKKEKSMFSHLINTSRDSEKDELVTYYKLLVLVESILKQYNISKTVITE